MSELTELLDKTPGVEFEYYKNEIYYIDEILDDVVTVTTNADNLLEDHFDGNEIAVQHSSGDPTREESYTVTGYEYIEHYFNGNYAEAFKFFLDHE